MNQFRMNNSSHQLSAKPEEQYMFSKTNHMDYSALDTNLKLIQDMLLTQQSAQPSQIMSPNFSKASASHKMLSQRSASLEDNVSALHQQRSCEMMLQQEEPPVEQRLLNFNEIYKQRKEEAYQQLQNGEFSLTQYNSNKSGSNLQHPQTTSYRPQINQLSDKIASNLENRVGKVEDRLYGHHKKQQAKQRHIEEKSVREAKENANPKILKKSQDIQSKKPNEGAKPIEERLIGFQKRYDGKKQQLEEKYKESCSFKPEINTYSKTRSGYQNRPHDLLYQPLKKQILQVSNDQEHTTFKPALSKKTIELAEKKKVNHQLGQPSIIQYLNGEDGNVYERLAMLQDRQESLRDDNQPTFVPQINQISDELDNRTKVTQGGKERWQTLYELGIKKKEEMEEIRRNHQEQKEIEELSCSFRPQLKQNRLNESEFGNRISIADRTKMWAENKMKKIEMLKEAIVDKDIDECTFQPLIHKNTVRHTRQTSRDSPRNSKQTDMTDQVQQTTGGGASLKNGKSVERFVSRLKGARQDKELTQQELSQQVGSGKVWKNKVTVPVEPNFAGRTGNTSKVREVSNSTQRLLKSKHEAFQPNLSQLIDTFGGKSSKNSSKQQLTSFSQLSGATTIPNNKYKRPTREVNYVNTNDHVKLEPQMEFESCVSLLHSHIQSLDI